MRHRIESCDSRQPDCRAAARARLHERSTREAFAQSLGGVATGTAAALSSGLDFRARPLRLGPIALALGVEQEGQEHAMEPLDRRDGR